MQHAVNRGTMTGMTSSLAFASNQGIELVDPDYVKRMNAPKVEDVYFNKNSGFRTILNGKLNQLQG